MEKFENRSFTKCLEKIKEWSQKHHSIEVCGFMGYNEEGRKYIVTLEKNSSPQPDTYFVLDPLSFLVFKQQNEVIGIYHSHIVGDEKPSEFDIKMSENCCIPFWIYGLDTQKISVHEPIHKEYNVKVFKRAKARI